MTLAQRRAEAEFEGQVPGCVRWSPGQVADWIEELGLPQYRECFTVNAISGRKLIFLDMSSLPKIGITDHAHLKVITGALQEMLGQDKPDYSRSIARPSHNTMGLYLLAKSPSGRKADNLTLTKFLRGNGRYLDNWH